MVKGQKIAVRMLKQEIRNKNLPAALLFHGPEGCGKFLTSLELARVVNCRDTGSSDCTCSSCVGVSRLMSRNIFLICKSNLKNTFDLWQRFGIKSESLSWFYRDLQRLALSIYDEERYNRDLANLEEFLRSPYEIIDNFQKAIECAYTILDSRKGQLISINRIREIQRYLWLKSSEGNYKVVIIDGAENMNEEASNSFLKISEDTPPESIIIITAVNKDLLKETIRSRFRTYRFVLLSDEVKREVFSEHFGVNQEYDMKIEKYDLDTMKNYKKRLKDQNLHLKGLTEIINEIITRNHIISFLDYTMDSLKENIGSADTWNINKIYEIEGIMKTISFIKKAILYNNVNQEVAFTNFMLNTFSSHLK